MEMDGTQDESLGQNARPGPSYMMDKRESVDALLEDLCDSGLDSFGAVGLGFEANVAYIEAEARWASERSVLGEPSPDESVNKSTMDCVSIGGGERLDSAIGDSINEDAVVGCLSDGIGTMILSEPAGTEVLSGSKPEVDRPRREEILNMMTYLSEDGDSVLHLALIHGHWDIVNNMLEEISLNSNWIPYLDIQNDLGQTALHLAVIVDKSEYVRALLCNGANAELQDREGNTTLHLAVREHRKECVRELTSCSRTRPEYLNITNYKGMSALHRAVQKGNCSIIKMLLDAGADANQQDLGSGRSPLHLAVEGQRSAVVGLLVSAGSVVNQRSYSGHTPLYISLYRPSKEVQAILSNSGATYTQEDEDEEEEENIESDEELFDDVVINGQRLM